MSESDDGHEGLVSRLPRSIEPDLDPEDLPELIPTHVRAFPALAGGLDGRVLDLGAGDASSVPHFEREAADDVTVHCLEPRRFLANWGPDTVAESPLDVHQVQGRGETLPYPEDSFDAVVSKEVLCAVDDVAATLSELRRVLRPGGELRYFEHVHSAGLAGRVESAVAPHWKRAISWCNVDRANDDALAASDFEVVEQYRYTDVGLLPPWTYVAGVARLPDPE